jgi:hypothetical protein
MKMSQVEYERNKRVGAVLTFAKGCNLEDVKEALISLVPGVETIIVQEYDSSYGDPVFYIP